MFKSSIVKTKIKYYHKFQAAFNGLYLFFLKDKSTIMHYFCFLLLVTLDIFIGDFTKNFKLGILLFTLAISLEFINTIFEKTVDYISKSRNLAAKEIKDLSAGLVLFGAIMLYGYYLLLITLKL